MQQSLGVNMQPITVDVKESISILVDGQLPDVNCDSILRSMDSPDARDCWLTYQLIGDVLRSSDLAHGHHDDGLAARVSAQLRTESLTITPEAELAAVVHRPKQVAANDGVFRWKILAGVASVAAVAAIGWGGWSAVAPLSAGMQLTRLDTSGGAASGQAFVLAADASAEGGRAKSMEDTSSAMLRDRRLDELLAAHRAATGASTLGGASGFLRNATFEGTGR